jgi:hypothetical protein
MTPKEFQKSTLAVELRTGRKRLEHALRGLPISLSGCRARVRRPGFEQTKQNLVEHSSDGYLFALSFLAITLRLAAIRMTLGVRSMGGYEVFVDHPTCSGQWSFSARVRNRKGTHFTTNFTPYMTL